MHEIRGPDLSSSRLIARREFLQRAAAGLVGLGVAPSIVRSPLAASTMRENAQIITVLHTNDVHSRIDPFPLGAGRYAGLGGAARRGSLIRAIRAQNPNTLVVDAGDAFQGTPYFNLFRGEVDFRVMSALGYDAMNIGNHEFDLGLEGLRSACRYATFPLLSANYDFANTPVADLVKPYLIRQVGNARVGLFGLGVLLEGLVVPRLAENVKYSDPISMARRTIARLRSVEDCDLIVCLSHLGTEGYNGQPGDMHLARDVEGIDLIVGGHSHIFMDAPGRFPHGDRETLVFQVGSSGINLGRVDFHVRAGAPPRAHGCAIPVGGPLADDPEAAILGIRA